MQTMPDSTSQTSEPRTFRALTLAAWRREPLPHVLFQPRFEPWFSWHEQFDSLPEACRGKSIREVYQQVGCSMRYCHYFTGQPDPVRKSFDPSVRITAQQVADDRERITYHTPHGDLVQERQFTIDKTWRTVVFPCESAADLSALEWLLPRVRHEFDSLAYAIGDAFIGDLGAAQFWVPKSPYMTLCQVWMDFETFIYALADAPQQIERMICSIDQTYDTLYEQLCAQRATPIINFGENIAEAYMSPTYFRRYLLPWYEKRAGQLHDAGIYTHIHIDGFCKSLLPLLAKLPQTGIEALTPLPQGDITLDQIAEYTGDKVLLDVIPAILFMEHHHREELYTYVQRIVELFKGRLILGISDELPQAATDEGYERLLWVADYARKHS
jgi:hypothetical protein